MRLKGVHGFIRWGYDTAATLKGWSVYKHKDGTFRLAGTVVESHPFRVTQRPLTFVAPVQSVELRWDIAAIAIENGAVKATFGKRET